ncbi:unnamed protein product [marine sediment metagenome]|uniref:Beta-ketoacyl synthase C-terminal domain-containing protein n=1 Tax=marine sediment metagenome TaxID=412755 RepID=X1RXZ7_9ZZZZ
MLEDLESARQRGARIYAEVLGGAVNCGGHRSGGTMTAPNPEGVQRCIRNAISDADITFQQIDAISGHLTATFADPGEVKNWSLALERGPENFPYINSTKPGNVTVGILVISTHIDTHHMTILMVFNKMTHPI